MCELYLSSSETPHFPIVELQQLQRHGGAPWTNMEGWGAAWLQDDGDHFGLEKHPQPARGAAGYDGLLHRAYPSRVHLVHLRAASSGGVSRDNTQPYRFEALGTGAAYVHNGELKGMGARLVKHFGKDSRDGSADSEGGMLLLCDALQDISEPNAAWAVFQNWAQDMRTMGMGNFIVALGTDIFVHVHRRTELGGDAPDDTGLYMAQQESRLRLSSEPLSPDDTALDRGSLLWIRGAQIMQRGLTI